jgi:DNA-binding NtrC family response regulator
MHEIPVLITGETGSGKELAARCIGWSRYLSFDPATRRFARKYHEDFHVRNLCAVPDNLVESELFGHVKGSFTGATADKQGLFALLRAEATAFFDEAGEMPLLVQAKLLRPFESREYTPVGGHQRYPIPGRLIFATNKDLEAACKAGTFRLDLFERMNGFRIRMPALRTMLAEMPRELHRYVRAFVGEKFDDPVQVEALTERVVATIPPGLPWEGNLRELKKYTERVLLGGGSEIVPESAGAPVSAPAAAGRSEAESRPKKTSRPPPEGAAAPMSMCAPSSGILGPEAKAGRVTAATTIRNLVNRVHAITGENKSLTARLTGLDRKTVSGLLDEALLARFRKNKK